MIIPNKTNEEVYVSHAAANDLPLSGIRVIEFSHMVMGPAGGLVLADLGAEVIRVEPLSGDKTRTLKGSGAGYFAMYNRNKKSIRLNLKSEDGIRIARDLVNDADVLIENFRPGAMNRLGLDYETLSGANERLIYCSTHGFLKGPYEHRTALDEVAQMMGGLSYMTGPPGRPLRAGASVIDVMGGVWGAVGVLAALEERHRTGKGQQIKSSLYESTVFLVGQHIAQYAVTGAPAAPMPARVSAWAIYDVFETSDDEKVFVGVVSDPQWLTFCEDFGFDDLLAEEHLRANNNRVAERERIIPIVRERFAAMTKQELMDRLESSGLPFAPIERPQDLLDDPHLNESGGLLDLTLPDGKDVRLPALPFAMEGERFGARLNPPRSGEHTVGVLKELGYDDGAIAAMVEAGAVAGETD
ncbi:MAG: CaiB/BaiF CoA-transferase family protein [Woeseiaceae bacterium]|nr:CaiB/BaiF CoA-transferase family protein [Woeseiaceae bacterium]